MKLENLLLICARDVRMVYINRDHIVSIDLPTEKEANDARLIKINMVDGNIYYMRYSPANLASLVGECPFAKGNPLNPNSRVMQFVKSGGNPPLFS